MGNAAPQPAVPHAHDHEPVITKRTERGHSESQNIQYAVSGMQGLRHTMEDHHLLCNTLPITTTTCSGNGEANLTAVGAAASFDMTTLSDHSIFAVFDGHGGDFTSSYLNKNILTVLSKRPELAKYVDLPKTGMKSRSDVTGIQLLRQALLRTFIELDQQLIPLQQERNRQILEGKIPAPPRTASDDDIPSEIKPPPTPKGSPHVAERSGSTGIVVLLTPSHIICANTGDSRAVLRRHGNVLPLSFDHKPTDTAERRRILAAGGVVKGKRVDGDLAVSRAFGDFVYKQDKSLSIEKQRVAVVPDLLVYPRDMAGDEFILVACDGIWDVASNKQCTEFVQSLLSEGEIDLGFICEEAIDTCLDRNSRDNMTLMMIGLAAMNVNTSQSAVVNNVLFGHRSARQTKRLATYTHRACITMGGNCVPSTVQAV
jgi:serine/threonine protein phosphatase PrpC